MLLTGRVADAMALLPPTNGTEPWQWTQMVEFQTLSSLIFEGVRLQLFAGLIWREAHHPRRRGCWYTTRARQEVAHQAYALHLLGDIAARREPPEIEPAEAHYQHALALAEALGMRPLQAHCHYGLGTLYSQTGRAALARAALSTAIEMYRAMDMTFWLPQAEAALAQGQGP